MVKAGDYKHGLDFSFEQNHKTGDISSIKNYVMKYMAKTFVDGMKDWTAQEFVFNAIAWKYQYWFFGCSRDLSKVMKREITENKDFTWLSTSLLQTDTDEIRLLNKNPNWEKVS